MNTGSTYERKMGNGERETGNGEEKEEEEGFEPTLTDAGFEINRLKPLDHHASST